MSVIHYTMPEVGCLNFMLKNTLIFALLTDLYFVKKSVEHFWLFWAGSGHYLRQSLYQNIKNANLPYWPFSNSHNEN